MGKFLDSNGVTTMWNKTKALVANKIDDEVNDKLGKSEGIATLDTSGKLPTAQLPSLRTVNGTSIVGDGDISIDLSLYMVVDSLPTTDINEDKIYLVVDTNNVEGNIYDEFIYVNNSWEKLGSYRATVDLADYIKDTDALTTAELEELLTD